MTVTKNMLNLDIYNIAVMLTDAFKQEVNLPVKINFYLQKNITTILTAAKDIDKTRNEIIKKYCVLDDANQYIVSKDDIDNVNQDLETLLALTQDIIVYPLYLEDFGEITLSTSQMAAIMFMIEE